MTDRCLRAAAGRRGGRERARQRPRQCTQRSRPALTPHTSQACANRPARTSQPDERASGASNPRPCRPRCQPANPITQSGQPESTLFWRWSRSPLLCALPLCRSRSCGAIYYARRHQSRRLRFVQSAHPTQGAFSSLCPVVRRSAVQCLLLQAVRFAALGGPSACCSKSFSFISLL